MTDAEIKVIKKLVNKLIVKNFPLLTKLDLQLNIVGYDLKTSNDLIIYINAPGLSTHLFLLYLKKLTEELRKELWLIERPDLHIDLLP